MARKHINLQIAVVLFVLSIIAAVPAFAGSAVIGSAVAGSNAMVGDQTLIPGATIMSGDKLEVANGAAVVTMGNGSRMVFGRDTVASFSREAESISATLEKGSVSLYHPAGDNTTLRLKIGDAYAIPANGFATAGEIAMIGNNLVVTTKEGQIRLEGNGTSLVVPKGKTTTITPRTARAPQGAGGGGHSNTSIAAGIAAAASITAAILAGVSLSRSDNAQSSAAAAESAANSAAAAANSAAAAANSAAAASSAALSAAQTSLSNSVAAVCAIDQNTPGGSTNPPSPYVPVGGTCP